ncbi:hypothetical protein WJX84_011394 [Apatococcus fuscideae]|uniref:Uncharacterized protein n=1 Tax=Apatococcus fuscideae TaxID=2026836 RepID=A0AAW1SVZ2_9CHLO
MRLPPGHPAAQADPAALNADGSTDVRLQDSTHLPDFSAQEVQAAILITKPPAPTACSRGGGPWSEHLPAEILPFQAAAPTAADLSGTPLGFIDRSNQQAAGCRAMGIVAAQGAAGTLGIPALPRQSQGDRDEGKAE